MADDNMDVDAVGPLSPNLFPSNSCTVPTVLRLPVDQLKTVCSELEAAADDKQWSFILKTSHDGSRKMQRLRSTVLHTITHLLSNTDLKDNVLSTSTEDEAAKILANFTAEESNMFEAGLAKSLNDKNWADMLTHPRLLRPTTSSKAIGDPNNLPVQRPAKRQRLASEDGTAISPMSDAVDTSQTAAHGVGQGSPPPKVTLADAIRQAKVLLGQNSHALKSSAIKDPKLDGSKPFFVDGLGALFDKDPSTRDRVVKLFEPGMSRVLFNTSGSGKTRLLVEGLCQHWGLYFTPDPNPLLGSVDFSRSIRNVGSYIDSDISFALDLPESPRQRRTTLGHNRTIARTVFLSVLLARLLVFEAFLHAGAGIPAPELRRRWTYLQLMPSVLQSQFFGTEKDIFARIYRTIEHHGDVHLVDAHIENLRWTLSASPLFIVLDEAQICSNQYEGAFQSKSEAGSRGIPSVLREIFTTWGPSTLANTAVLFSGTGFSLTKVLKALSSSIGVVDDSVFTDMGAFVSEEQQAAYIMRHVKLDEDSREEVLRRAWRWLRGRHRFTGGFVYILQRCGTKNASALLTRYVQVLTNYVPTDSSNMALTPDEGRLFPDLDSISQHFQKLDVDDLLRRRVALAINTFVLRHKPHLVNPSDAKTIELGISRYTTSSEGSFKSIVIDEPLIIATALQYFDSRTESIEEMLRENICCLPIGAIRGYDLEAVGMYILAQQFDGTKSLREIFKFQTDSINIGTGKAQLIAIDKIDQDGTLQYSIVNKPWLYPFGMGFEASKPSEHERWFKGTGVPFCFPDTRSGHDVGFFVLVDGNSVVFVMDQFKSFNKNLSAATTKRALKSISPAGCYKDKNQKIYLPGKSARKTLLRVLKHSQIPCLGILTSFPSNPHLRTINEKAPEHFALFDLSEVEGELGRVLTEFKDDQFPDLGGGMLPEWPVEATWRSFISKVKIWSSRRRRR